MLIVIEIIKVAGIIIAAALTWFLNWRFGKFKKQMDGHMDELLAARRAEGKREGIAEEKAKTSL